LAENGFPEWKVRTVASEFRYSGTLILEQNS
jgi:hypothetical protein